MKPLTSLLLTTTLAIGSLDSARANGGGYSFGLEFSGDVAPFQPAGTEHIEIAREDLHIQLGKEAAKVSVRYVMRNVASKSVEVKFGFPVESNAKGASPFDLITVNEETADEARTLEGLRASFHDYEVTVDNKPAPSELVLEPFSLGKVSPFPGSEALEGIGGWMVSEVTFDTGEEKVVTIDYRAVYCGSKRWISTVYNHSATPKTFVYRLSTGAVWHGPIRQGQIIMTLDGASPDTTVVQKPAGRFSRDGDAWILQFEDLEPTLADDIEIQIEPGLNRHPDSAEGDSSSVAFWERENRWYWEHKDYQVRASSTLAPGQGHRYDAENVRHGGKNAVAWVEGVDGAGAQEYLEFTFPTPRPIVGIVVSPGFTSDENLFQANNRPKELEIHVNDSQDSVVITLEDNREDQPFWFPAAFAVPENLQKLRLTIRSVYRGNRFEDTCISGVHFLTPLPKKPQFRGAR